MKKLQEILNKERSYYICTAGHAMCCIDGILIDTANGGWNHRKVENIWEVSKV